MGRAERRKIERKQRIETRKGQILIDPYDVWERKRKAVDGALQFNAELLMTCIGIAEHRLYGFGQKRVLRTLSYIDDLMGMVNDGYLTVDELKEQLREETNVKITC